MSKEKLFWSSLSKKMRGRWSVQRHEDKYTEGIPDVSYGINGQSGWIELKVLKEWPKLLNTIVRVPHLKPTQRAWLLERGSHSQTWLFLKIEKDYILLDGRDVFYVGKTLRKSQLIALSKKYWEKYLDVDEFTRIISEPYSKRDSQTLS